MARSSRKLSFQGSQGVDLAALLELPDGEPRAYILFAHCFTCSKDTFAASRIAGALSQLGFAVLRFDFTGLGASDGEFANTNFSSNVADLVKAADFLRENYQAPQILIGHSLGGAAVLAGASQIPESCAVATIGAPADAGHVIKSFGARVDEIETSGIAEVQLAGRNFTIKKQFLEDLKSQTVQDHVHKLGKALIVFHAPLDQTVGIENAGLIFQAAKHPKSFVSLDDADHLLSRRSDAIYVASVLSAWAERYIPEISQKEGTDVIAKEGWVTVEESGRGKYRQNVIVGAHMLAADEPVSAGGDDAGPKPHDFLSIGLGACTSMTLRMYAERKQLQVEHIRVDVKHEKVKIKDMEGKEKAVSRFERVLEVTGDIDDTVRQRLLEIANMCPVHKTLESSSQIVTKSR